MRKTIFTLALLLVIGGVAWGQFETGVGKNPASSYYGSTLNFKVTTAGASNTYYSGTFSLWAQLADDLSTYPINFTKYYSTDTTFVINVYVEAGDGYEHWAVIDTLIVMDSLYYPTRTSGPTFGTANLNIKKASYYRLKVTDVGAVGGYANVSGTAYFTITASRRLFAPYYR